MTERILVTAGNTWAPLDKVRVLTNIFSGETGLRIAHSLARSGFKVTLILADIRVNPKPYRHKRLKIIRALTYKAFYKAVKKEVKRKIYRAVVHAAAVSDFYLKKPLTGKISSRKNLKLTLSRTSKIVNRIKKWDPKIILIKFKLEAGKKKRQLLKIALKSKKQSKANLIIANQIPTKRTHTFYVIKSSRQHLKITGKKALASKLTKIFKKELSDDYTRD